MQEEGSEVLYEVSVSGDGISIKKSVPSEIARGVMSLLMGGAAPQSPGVIGQANSTTGAAAPTGASASGAGARMSLREFLDDTQATRNPDKITTIAEYLLQHEGTELFTKDDIKGRFRSAGEAPPGNFPRDFSWTVKNGWIAEEIKTPGSYYVTKKGREAINNKFSGEVKKSTSLSTRRRSRKSGANAEAKA